jgi:hypothetical protein
MVYALLILSEGGEIPTDTLTHLVDLGPDWITQSRIGFVVIDRARSSAPLRDFAIRALRLEFVEADGDLELYRPVIK